MDGWITDDELLQQGTELGARATPRRIKRWRKEGLLQRSIQQHVAGRRGSVSLCPSESVHQLIALYRLHQKERRLDELRFFLWWEGYFVDRGKLRAGMRDTLRKLGAKLHVGTEALKRAAKKEEPDPDLVPAVAAERLAGNLAGTSRFPLVRLMRRNLRRQKADVLSALMVLAQLVLGVTPIFGDALNELGEMTPEKSLFVGAGLAPATAVGPGGTPPWIPGGAATLPDALAEVEKIGIADVPQLAQLVEEASNDEFDQARIAARFLIEDMPVFVKGFSVLFGRDVMGLGFFAHFDRVSTTEKILLIPLFITMNRRFGTAWIDGLRVGMQQARPQAEALSAIARSFPQYKNYFTLDVAQKLAALPEKERARIINDLGGYLRDHHPDVFNAT